MGEFIDDGDFRPTSNDCVDIHFPKRNAAILDASKRDAFEVTYQSLCVRTSVGLDEPHDYVDALPLQQVSVFEHLVRLAHPWSGPDVDTQSRTLLLALPDEQRVCC